MRIWAICVCMLVSGALSSSPHGEFSVEAGIDPERHFAPVQSFESFSDIVFEVQANKVSDSQVFTTIPREESEIADADKAKSSVDVPGGKMSLKPVTNKEYQSFIESTKRTPPPHWKGGRVEVGSEHKPVVNVSYDDAESYARWASKRLPTHTEWMSTNKALPLDYGSPINEWTSSSAGHDIDGPKKIIFNRQDGALSTVPAFERNLQTGFRVVSPSVSVEIQAPAMTTPSGNVILPDQRVMKPTGTIFSPGDTPYNEDD